MNEETIIEKRPVINGQQETKKEGIAWKHVTLGGVSGILMGAGLLYAGQAVAATKTDVPEEATDATTTGAATAEAQQADSATEATLPVAQMHNDLSFGEAFAAARAEVGPGGVFIWHGGIYNTYTADEWNAMSVDQKHDFAQQVKPEISVDQVSTPTDANTHVVVEHHVYHHHEEAPAAAEVHQVADTSNDVQVARDQTADASDADVHIVGYGEVEGHVAVGLDTDGDGQADVAIIDVDDSGGLSDPDVIVDNHGNMATYGEINNATPDPNLTASMENPDVAPDMPDYMNDANIDDMNVLA